MTNRFVVFLGALVLTFSPVVTTPQTAGAQADLGAGIRLMEEGDLDQAVIALDAVVQRLTSAKGKEKELALAHLYLGMAHLGLSQWERARAEMREAWRNDKDMKLDP